MKSELENLLTTLRDTTDKLSDLQYTHLCDLIEKINNIHYDLETTIYEIECEVENLEVKE